MLDMSIPLGRHIMVPLDACILVIKYWGGGLSIRDGITL
jgi:hypothetical protein